MHDTPHCTAQVENFGALRYERSREVQAHGRILTQRHEATNAEVAMSQGDRPLVGMGCQVWTREGVVAPLEWIYVWCGW